MTAARTVSGISDFGLFADADHPASIDLEILAVTS
jgi:hypothetical protein